MSDVFFAALLRIALFREHDYTVDINISNRKCTLLNKLINGLPV